MARLRALTEVVTLTNVVSIDAARHNPLGTSGVGRSHSGAPLLPSVPGRCWSCGLQISAGPAHASDGACVDALRAEISERIRIRNSLAASESATNNERRNASVRARNAS